VSASSAVAKQQHYGLCGNGHDLETVAPGLLVDMACNSANTPAVSPDVRLATAFHEAAHAVVAIANGQLVRHVTIKPTPASDYAPGSLGHICMWPMPPPAAEDCWVGSHWVESYLMVYFAGYLIEDLLFPDAAAAGSARRAETGDHHRAVTALRTVLPHDVPRAVSVVARLRSKCVRLLAMDAHVALLLQIAHVLLCEETINEDQLYRRLLAKRCHAIHPTDPTLRCTHPPHPYLEHMILDHRAIHEKWRGFRIPPSREKVTALPGNVRRLRAVNRGGPGPRLSKAWTDVLDACEDLAIPANEWHATQLSDLRAALTTAEGDS
jgi:hypothetical protein